MFLAAKIDDRMQLVRLVGHRVDYAASSRIQGQTRSYSERFMTEASASLPVVARFDLGNHLERVFSGVRDQRVRLKCYQQLAEWDVGG